jgi:lactate permease
MAGLHWTAAPAGLAGLAAVLPVALLVFGWRGPEAAGGVGIALASVAAEVGFAALTILWIVVPALVLHELQRAGGAAETLRRALARLSDDPRLAALLVAWFFALFAEGAAGFGAPVALALVGHAVGVSFGAVATPVVPQAAASGLAPEAIAGATALLHAALAGVAWPLLAPKAAVLGTFVTGSATASNILLTDFPLATTAALGGALLLFLVAAGVAPAAAP